jgi:hypothetical protein
MNMSKIGYSANFTTAFALGKTATKVNVTDFTSLAFVLPQDAEMALLLLTFTRAAGSASLTLDYYFQVSGDGGTTWWDYIEPLSIETGHAVITGTTVRVARQLSLAGFTNIRLASVVNNDTVNDLTAVNAGISF